jgi:LysM repeat protein
VLGLGFGLLQTINRPDPAPALLALGQSETPAIVANTASITGAGPAQVAPGGSGDAGAPAADAPRRIQSSATVIQPTYTVQAGDTLSRIAVRYSTTVERIQALNNLTDPRALRIGAQLIIPPPF